MCLKKSSEEFLFTSKDVMLMNLFVPEANKYVPLGCADIFIGSDLPVLHLH
jgi:hypothetical protein